MEINLGFIGTGNMGGAMIESLVKSGVIPVKNIFASDMDRVKLSNMCEELGIQACKNNMEVAEKCDMLILCVKPNIVQAVLNEIKYPLKDKVFITIAAGLPMSFYKNTLCPEQKMVRVMPNTPAMVGEGMTVISYDNLVSNDEREIVKNIFECFGKVEIMEEKYMNKVIALTSSSPAYVYIFIEAMADAAVKAGIPRAVAYKLASQAVLGSAKMVLETGKHPGELKDQVCSPAGTTIEAVSALEKNGFRFAVMDAMEACTKKADDMSK